MLEEASEREEGDSHDGHADEDLPGGKVKLINGVLEPANKQVVDERQRYGGCHSIVCANVAEDGDFGSNLDIAEDEAHEEAGEGALIWPLVQWMENQFVAAICVFFPASELVVDSQGDTFFEAAIVVSCKANDEMVHLETQTDVKVFRDMVIRPEFCHTGAQSPFPTAN
jgi:hypothetical protein